MRPFVLAFLAVVMGVVCVVPLGSGSEAFAVPDQTRCHATKNLTKPDPTFWNDDCYDGIVFWQPYFGPWCYMYSTSYCRQTYDLYFWKKYDCYDCSLYASDGAGTDGEIDDEDGFRFDDFEFELECHTPEGESTAAVPSFWVIEHPGTSCVSFNNYPYTYTQHEWLVLFICNKCLEAAG